MTRVYLPTVPLGGELATLTGNPADDAKAIGAGTGVELAILTGGLYGAALKGSDGLVGTLGLGGTGLAPAVMNATRGRIDAVATWGLPSDGTDGSSILAAMFADATAQARGIWVPDGTYTLQTAININNPVDMLCAPGAKFVTSGAVVGNALFSLNAASNYNVLTGYSPMNNLNVGDSTVVLTNAGDIAALGTSPGFNVGDWVVLRCNDTGALPPYTPIAELNRILSLTGSGFVLEWPMAKAMTITATTLNQAGVTASVPANGGGLTLTSAAGLTQTYGSGAVQVDSEIIYYTSIVGSTLTNITRGYGGSTPAAHTNGVLASDVFGVRKNTVIESMRFTGLNVDHQGSVFTGAMVNDVLFRDCKWRCRKSVVYAAIRKQRVYNCEVYLYSDPLWPGSDSSYFWIAAATGFTDTVIDGLLGRAQSGGYLHVHEYGAKVKCSNLDLSVPPGVDQSYPIISIAGGGHDISIRDFTITNAGRDAIKVFPGAGSVPENVTIKNGRVFGTIGRGVVTAPGIKGIVVDDVAFRGTQTNGATYPAFDLSAGKQISATRLKIADDAVGVVTGLALGTAGSGYVAGNDLNNVSGSPLTVNDHGTYQWGSNRGHDAPSSSQIFIPRGAFTPIAGLGTPPTLAAVGAGTYGMALSFADAVNGYAEVTVKPPVDWSQWTISMLWGRTDLGSSALANVDAVTVTVYTAPVGPGQSIATFGTNVVVSGIGCPAQNAMTETIVVNNYYPGAKNLGMRLVIERNGANVADTFTGNMLLLGAYLTKNNAYI